MRQKELSKMRKNTKSFIIKTFFQSSILHYFIGLILLISIFYMSISMISFFFSGNKDQIKIEGFSLFDANTIEEIGNWAGFRGAIIGNILINEWFGLSTFFLLFFLCLVALQLMKVCHVRLIFNFIFCSLSTILSSIVLSFFFDDLFKETVLYIGGKHGSIVSHWLVHNFGATGTFLFMLLMFLFLLTLRNDNAILFLIRLSNRKKERKTLSKHDKEFSNNPIFQKKETFSKEKIYTLQDFEVVKPANEETIICSSTTKINDKFFINTNRKEKILTTQKIQALTSELSDYKYPSIELLKQYNIANMPVNMEEQTANKNRIRSTLDSFGIKIAMIKATVGPTITMYEIQPEAGVRISKIKNLENDIALRLSALGIRIIAHIPGKGTIGIEVPHINPQTVSMRSVIISKRFQEALYDLPIALGKTIMNETFVFDLCKMPHLLVAGATGQGKSVGLNVIIASLLYKKHPSQLKFVLIDPKKVEFNTYSAIEKQFLAKLPNEEESVITDVNKVVQTLNSLTKEMDNRYNLLKKAHVRNIKEYNEKFVNHHLNPTKGHRYMPYFVVIVDEFGDLIMTVGKEVELPIARIAQLARAVGIHIIIATQRPSTNIITGIIKANFPARIAFRVSSMVDSRTILDVSGANQLVGKGDLLFSQGSDLTRIQCAFIDTSEVEKMVEYISNQRGYPTAEILPEYVNEEQPGKFGSIDLSERDPLFKEVARLIVIHQQGSASLIQRKFEVGYNRAGRLMDQLEATGIVGAYRGSKPREVLVADECHLEKILDSF